jgi:cell division protein FtsL
MITLRRLGVVALMVVVVITAIAIVYSKHQSRQLFIRLQAMSSERDALGIEWGRLQLEQSTLATPTQIERLARKRLGMYVPTADEIVIIKNEVR